MPTPFGTNSPFAEFDRISAEMNRKAAAILQQAATLATQPNGATETAVANWLRQRKLYLDCDDVGRRRVHPQRRDCLDGQWRRAARGVAHLPKSRLAAARFHHVPRDAGAEPGPEMIMTKATGTRPYAGLIREADLTR
jgi:hypothetical protein